MEGSVTYTYDAELNGVDISTFEAGYQEFGTFIINMITPYVGTRKPFHREMIKVIENPGGGMFQTKYTLTKPFNQPTTITVKTTNYDTLTEVCSFCGVYTAINDVKLDLAAVVAGMGAINTAPVTPAVASTSTATSVSSTATLKSSSRKRNNN